MRALSTRTTAVILALALVPACTMSDQDPPPLSGPAELGTSVTVTVSPDILTQDGASQSVVTVFARDANGQPLRNLSLRNEINVAGASADFGSLSARSVVTGSDGRATFVYTAPVSAPGSPDTGTVVNIMVTPIGGNYNESFTRFASIRLVPPGNVPFPAGLQPAFTTSPSAPLEGQNVLFDASTSTSPATNPIAAYAWDFGDGSTGSGRTTTHAYRGPGNYFARLTISDAVGRSASITQTITVGQSTAPTAAFVRSPTNAVINSPVNFNASASSASAGRRIVSYTWDFGDGSALETTGSPVISHTYTVARTYTVTLVVTDDIGRTASTSVTVQVAIPSTP